MNVGLTPRRVFVLLACALFILAAIGAEFGKVSFIAAGLFCLAAAHWWGSD